MEEGILPVPMHSSPIRHKIELQETTSQKLDPIHSAAHKTNLYFPL